jgi:hypothetical protein
LHKLKFESFIQIGQGQNAFLHWQVDKDFGKVAYWKSHFYLLGLGLTLGKHACKQRYFA